VSTVRGLVLGGGGVPGIAAHLGFLQGIAQARISWDVMVGISAGGIVAGSCGAEYDAEYDVRDTIGLLQVLEKRWRSILRFPWLLLPEVVPFAAWIKRSHDAPGLLCLQWILEKAIADHDISPSVSSWKKGYGVIASDVTEGRPVLISCANPAVRDTLSALTATAAFPGLFSGVRARRPPAGGRRTLRQPAVRGRGSGQARRDQGGRRADRQGNRQHAATHNP